MSKEREIELLNAELNRLHREVDALREQQKQESEPPLHLALVISISDNMERAVVLTSKRTLIEVSVRHDIQDELKCDLIVGLTRSRLRVVKIITNDKHEVMRGIFHE